MVRCLQVLLLFAALVGTHSLAENGLNVVEEAGDIGEGKVDTHSHLRKVDKRHNVKEEEKVEEKVEDKANDKANEAEGEEDEDEEGEEGEDEEEGEEGEEGEDEERDGKDDEDEKQDKVDAMMDEPLTDAQLRSMHTKIDKDGDGKVSFQEITTYFAEHQKSFESKNMAVILEDFGESDTNGDGSLSLEEHLAHFKKESTLGDNPVVWGRYQDHETAKFRAADLDHDGLLSKTELPHLLFPEHHEGVLSSSVDEMIRQNDEDKDGKLSPTEFQNLHGEDPAVPKENDEAVDFARLDIDGDGFLSALEMRDEASGQLEVNIAMKKLLDVADTDKDMMLTADELAGAMTQIQGSQAHYYLLEHADMAQLYESEL